MPPSPSLLARMTNVRYLTVTTRMSAQKISDRTPRTFGAVALKRVLPAERLAKRKERVRSDVAVDDAERAERERVRNARHGRRRRIDIAHDPSAARGWAPVAATGSDA